MSVDHRTAGDTTTYLKGSLRQKSSDALSNSVQTLLKCSPQDCNVEINLGRGTFRVKVEAVFQRALYIDVGREK